ncbi:MAG: HD domain-containing phosphohydrolase [Campylobacterales bacterium]
MLAGELRALTSGLSALYVEDEEAIRTPVLSILQALFERVDTAQNGLEGLMAYERFRPDVVITDIQMPHMDGLSMAKALRSENPAQAIVFVTAHGEPQMLMEAIALNADGYIPKPIVKEQFYDTLGKVARKIMQARELSFYHHHLEEAVRLKTGELEALNDEINQTLAETITTLGGIAEARSQETGQHVQRVALYSELLAKLAGLGEDEAALLKLISPMHDVGKLAIPDAILSKPGKLTEAEFELMKTHTAVGYAMLKSSSRPIFQMAAIVAYEHHERYDGKGYPCGLAGEAIHPFGRITALADVFDALLSDRVYKEAWPVERVVEYIQAEAGGQFDPALCALFVEHLPRFLEIKEAYRGG